MKNSNSMRWLVTRVLLFLALITVFLGIFTLPADLLTGGGLLLLGVSSAVFMAWMIRQEQGRDRSHRRWGAGITVVVSFILGSFFIAAGEKDSLVPVQTADEQESQSLPSSVPSTPTSTSPSSSSATSSTPQAPTTLTVTSTMQMEPEAVTVTSTFFMAPEEVTTTATVYIPAPQQNIQPPAASTFTEPSTSEESLLESPQPQSEETDLRKFEVAP